MATVKDDDLKFADAYWNGGGSVAEMRAQLAAAESARDADRAVLRHDGERISELTAQLAAAKPVLTAEECTTMRLARGLAPEFRISHELVAIIDRLCPPPQAPPTDAEIADAIDGGEFKWAAEALRARGGK